MKPNFMLNAFRLFSAFITFNVLGVNDATDNFRFHAAFISSLFAVLNVKLQYWDSSCWKKEWSLLLSFPAQPAGHMTTMTGWLSISHQIPVSIVEWMKADSILTSDSPFLHLPHPLLPLPPFLHLLPPLLLPLLFFSTSLLLFSASLLLLFSSPAERCQDWPWLIALLSYHM